MYGKEDSVAWTHLAAVRDYLWVLVNAIFNFLSSRETVGLSGGTLFMKLVTLFPSDKLSSKI
jgi:hypothetical protein